MPSIFSGWRTVPRPLGHRTLHDVVHRWKWSWRMKASSRLPPILNPLSGTSGQSRPLRRTLVALLHSPGRLQPKEKLRISVPSSYADHMGPECDSRVLRIQYPHSISISDRRGSAVHTDCRRASLIAVRCLELIQHVCIHYSPRRSMLLFRGYKTSSDWQYELPAPQAPHQVLPLFIMPIPTGRYIIQNIRTKNQLQLPDPNDGSPVQATSEDHTGTLPLKVSRRSHISVTL